MRTHTVDPKSHVAVVAEGAEFGREAFGSQPLIEQGASTLQTFTMRSAIPIDMVDAKELAVTLITALAESAVGIKHFFSKFVSSAFSFCTYAGTVRGIFAFDFVCPLRGNISALFALSANAAAATESRGKGVDFLSFLAYRACLMGQCLAWSMKLSFLIVLSAITKSAVLAMAMKPILVVGIRSKLIRRFCVFAQGALFTHLNTIIPYTGIVVQPVSKIIVQ